MSQPFRRDSYRSPHGIQKDSERTPGPPESGYGKGLLEAKKRREVALNWAAKHLPAEHPPFVFAAYEALRLSGQRPTAENVRARLADQGRDKASLERLT